MPIAYRPQRGAQAPTKSAPFSLVSVSAILSGIRAPAISSKWRSAVAFCEKTRDLWEKLRACEIRRSNIRFRHQ
jgi:hypothetical protein